MYSKHKIITKPTQRDLDDILSWLKLEFEKDREGFWCNRNIISKALDQDELYVIRRNEVAVAFQVGHYSADIVNVRQDLQNKGYGSALLEYSMEQARTNNVTVLRGECMPTSSLSYWEKHGFVRYGDMSEWGKITVRRIIPKSFEIPLGSPLVSVKISLYPESVMYKSDCEVEPIKIFQVNGVSDGGGIVQLSKRIVAFSNYGEKFKDTVVEIVIGSREICFCKVKYPEAEDAGWKYDPEGCAYYIDEIYAE